MMIFTMVWIAQINNPVAAYWAASYYRDMIGGERIERVEEEKEGFKKELEKRRGELEELSALKGGKGGYMPWLASPEGRG